MNILERIAETKRAEVEVLRRERGRASLESGARSAPPAKDFRGALRRPGKLSLIAEVKKASPSKGVIRPDFDPVAIARSYERSGAQALSVLTDREYFQGSLAYLRSVRASVALPLLRKDFMIDPLQVWEAREAGADAVLLIVAMLEPTLLSDLRDLILSLGMAALVEVHDEEELERALGCGAKLVGINNRNLKDFTVSLDVTRRLLPLCPAGTTGVSESGILSRADALAAKAAGAAAVLVGESFMRCPDPGAAAVELMPQGDLRD